MLLLKKQEMSFSQRILMQFTENPPPSPTSHFFIGIWLLNAKFLGRRVDKTRKYCVFELMVLNVCKQLFCRITDSKYVTHFYVTAHFFKKLVTYLPGRLTS